MWVTSVPCSVLLCVVPTVNREWMGSVISPQCWHSVCCALSEVFPCTVPFLASARVLSVWSTFLSHPFSEPRINQLSPLEGGLRDLQKVPLLRTCFILWAGLTVFATVSVCENIWLLIVFFIRLKAQQNKSCVFYLSIDRCSYKVKTWASLLLFGIYIKECTRESPPPSPFHYKDS